MKIFVSYAHVDAAACAALKQHLAVMERVFPATTVWYDGEIHAGAYWAQEIADHLNGADLILLLISAAFFHSRFCWEKEMPRALARHHAKEALVVPIIVDDIAMAWQYTEFARLQALPTGGKPIPAWDRPAQGWSDVINGLTATLLKRGLITLPTDHNDPFADAPAVLAGANGRLFNGRLFHVPRDENRFFTGRDEDLAWVERTLFSGNRNRNRPVALLAGLGGVGKSEAAAQYAHHQRDRYQTVWWIDAETAAGRDGGFAGLAEARKINGFDKTNPAATRAAVKQWLQETGDWLLIFDNAADSAALADWLPQRAGGHILITSRSETWRTVGDVLPVRQWPLAVAAEYLCDRSDDADQAAALALAADLGGLPLACAHAAAYVEDSGCGLASYHRLLRNKFADLAEPVVATFTLALARAADEEPLAGVLMNLLACLAPEPMPRWLLVEPKGLAELTAVATMTGEAAAPPPHPATAVADLSPPGRGDYGPIDEHAVNLALKALRKQALVNGSDELTVHRLVQQAARSRLSEPAAWDLAALALIKAAFPYDSDDARNWARCRTLRPHADAVLTAITNDAAPPATVDRLCNQLGLYLKQIGDYPAAETLYRRGLNICQKHFGPTAEPTAIALSNLGGLLAERGDLPAAAGYRRQALAIAPGNAIRLSNLGNLLNRQQDWPAAEPWLRRALWLDQTTLGPDHPHIAICLNNLAIALGEQGRDADARPLQERALAITRQYCNGDDHPAVAVRLNNLAVTLMHLGELSVAQTLCQQALAIREKWLPAGHPHIETSHRTLNVIEARLAAIAAGADAAD